jgi:hypothetical protein
MKTTIRITEMLFRILFWAVVVTACCALFSCRSVEYVPVETIRTDSIFIKQYERDSIHTHDSVFVKSKADTIYINHWRTVYRDRVVRDTVFESRVDSVQNVVEVEKKLTKWQQVKMNVGAGVMYAVPILIMVGLFVLYRKLKK